MDSPREPVPSLADAARLLLRSASAQARRSLQRRARPAAPPAGLDQLVTGQSVRRRLLSRQVLTCAALLLAIGTSAAALAWWSWQALQDRQVQLGGDQDLRTQRQSRSLVDDLVQREGNGVEAPAPVVSNQSGQATLDRPTASLPTSGAKSLSLDGRVVALGVITLTLTAATGAGWLVVRRLDRAPLAVAGDVETTADGPRTGTDDRAELDDRAGAEGSALPEPADPAASVARPPATDEPSRVPQDIGEPARSLSRPVEAPPELMPVGAGAPLPSTSIGYDLSAEAAARERIFDRRVSRRVPYEQPGWLWWAERNAPVTLQDLSLAGLRCVLTAAAGAAASEAPALGDQVRVFFPVNAATLKVGGRVEWKEQTSEGTTMGVEFIDLPAADGEVLRQLLVVTD